MQVERGHEQERPHIQGFIQLKAPIPYAAVKDFIGNNAHVEMAIHIEQAWAYCQKIDTRESGPYVHGALTKQGAKSKGVDMTKLWEDCKAKRSLEEMVAEDPKVLTAEKQIKFARYLLDEKASNRDPAVMKVIVYYGDTGCGKTWEAVHSVGSEDYYIAICPSIKNQKLWFDGYRGQSTLILDDFDSTYCSEAFLKRILDHYKMQCEIKGGHVWATWNTVIITSNFAPRFWYSGVSAIGAVDHAPLQRRIKEIYNFTSRGVRVHEDWDGNTIPDPVPDQAMADIDLPPPPSSPALVRNQEPSPPTM